MSPTPSLTDRLPTSYDALDYERTSLTHEDVQNIVEVYNASLTTLANIVDHRSVADFVRLQKPGNYGEVALATAAGQVANIWLVGRIRTLDPAGVIVPKNQQWRLERDCVRPEDLDRESRLELFESDSEVVKFRNWLQGGVSQALHQHWKLPKNLQELAELASPFGRNSNSAYIHHRVVTTKDCLNHVFGRDIPFPASIKASIPPWLGTDSEDPAKEREYLQFWKELLQLRFQGKPTELAAPTPFPVSFADDPNRQKYAHTSLQPEDVCGIMCNVQIHVYEDKRKEQWIGRYQLTPVAARIHGRLASAPQPAASGSGTPQNSSAIHSPVKRSAYEAEFELDFADLTNKAKKIKSDSDNSSADSDEDEIGLAGFGHLGA
ncbi:BZ3500_MvSof-1268-A1-R1_Chr4-4g07558 [Microbotryum saponariae]|uniref:BZ3500_MvSof-1268-A1-R1_Chr4-4g07558 protein n=1 Tax=Microbotryum saponariae TaxID=289078 RepID=A0A2X0LMN1_9BASI|nr:BZ3500_MvSof-1268-A1-R1_Chr4-4g07558 [Microbotryum saponariae]SDA07219.1 BZ3501_MvSof-1269-A2-R1_Chr4-3g07266 [Microbotryum saponariae]